MTAPNSTAPLNELPLLIEPDHWGVLFTRHLVKVLVGIVLTLALSMWFIASHTQIEHSLRGSVIAITPCMHTMKLNPSTVQAECIQFSFSSDAVEHSTAIPVRIEIEEIGTYRRFTLNKQAKLVTSAAVATQTIPALVDKLLFEAELDSMQISREKYEIKQVMLITGTQSAWAVFCHWFKHVIDNFLARY